MDVKERPEDGDGGNSEDGEFEDENQGANLLAEAGEVETAAAGKSA